RTVVIEEGLTGPELSLLVLCDGRDAVPLAPAQDFKRIGDGDAGPNTGGMGAYSPVPIVGPDVVEEVMAKAVAPTLEALGRPGAPRTGDVITGLDAAGEVEGVTVFHAGTVAGDRPGEIRTAGGRVLNVTALGATLAEARRRAYDAVDRISWPGRQYRHDIAAAAAAGPAGGGAS